MIEQYNGPDRRAPQPTADHWHLDKKVPISIIFAILMQAAVGLWAIADMKKDIEVLKMQNAEQRERDRNQDVRLSEIISQLRNDLHEVSVKLDRLVERNSR